MPGAKAARNFESLLPKERRRNARLTPSDLADAAREAGAEILRYQSARDPVRGVCIAVLICAAFAEASPKDRETWWVGLKQEQGAYAIRESPSAASPQCSGSVNPLAV